MRFTLAALALLFAASVRADEPNPRALLDAVEKQLKAVHVAAGPCVACVAVARSELYPKPAQPPAHAGQLGDFSPAAFLKDNPGKAKLAAHLDLADPKTITEHSYTGGVVVDAAGLVLTTYQPLDGATKIYVHLPGGKGSYADIHAADARCDLAVLRLLTPPPGLKPIKMGEVRYDDTSDGKKATVFGGKLVVLMTNPPVSGFRLDAPSGGLGTLSNVRRRLGTVFDGQEVTRSAYAYGTFLEHDARLFAGAGKADGRPGRVFDDPEARAHAGVSGAALLNLDGELIGLTSQGHAHAKADYGPGFAFPMDASIRRIVDVLKRGEEVEYGFLGVRLAGGRLDPNPTKAITISSVSPLSPAWAAGLQSFDTITHIGDVPVSSYGDLLHFAGASLAGTRIKLTVASNRGGVRTLDLTLGKYRNDLPFVAAVRPEPVFGLRVDHGSILAQRLANGLRGDDVAVPPGVCVREIAADSPAAAQFKTLGDGPTRWLITHANGVAVTTPAEFYKAAKGQAAVKLTLLDPTSDTPRPRDLTLP